MRRSTVVADEEDQRILFQLLLAHFRQHGAHGIIGGREHRREGAAFFVLDARESRQVLVSRLQRGVYGVERKVHEPRFALVLLDERHGLAPEGVGRIVDFLDYPHVPETYPLVNRTPCAAIESRFGVGISLTP